MLFRLIHPPPWNTRIIMVLIVVTEKITTNKRPEVIFFLRSAFVNVMVYSTMWLKGAEIK